MKLTKFEHACILVEVDDTNIIVDPGVLSKSFSANKHALTAVVYTHMHGDHFDASVLKDIIAHNPDVTVFAPADVLNQIQGISCKKITTLHNMAVNIGSFELRFYGHDHAVIYESVPCFNTGVLINNSVYYPGDSFVVPAEPVKVLAVPASAPWMKTSEAMDFIKLVSPDTVFPSHDGLLSEFGKQVTYNWLSKSAEQCGATWKQLEATNSLDLDDKMS